MKRFGEQWDVGMRKEWIKDIWNSDFDDWVDNAATQRKRKLYKEELDMSMRHWDGQESICIRSGLEK